MNQAKRCMICGIPTKSKTGFCSTMTGWWSCRAEWFRNYKTKPTKKELNAKWRMIK